ncbi:hypothetical protein GCM10023068_29030 [Leifsonia shinshuensis]
MASRSRTACGDASAALIASATVLLPTPTVPFRNTVCMGRPYRGSRVSLPAARALPGRLPSVRAGVPPGTVPIRPPVITSQPWG